jgi:mannose-6-phosphate isomerase
MRPLELPPNQLRRFYRGGARIAAFRGLATIDDDAPEDWVGSTTTVHGDDRSGLSRLPDGRLLREALAAEPESFLGDAHVASRGSDPGLLVKLLDAGQRLPLHLHPDAALARRHLGTRYGKTEAWIILEAVPGAAVHVGFARDLSRDELAQLVESQNIDRLVAAMNRVDVHAGDAIFVPAGVPHVIGDGILLLELQEPSDLSILLEWGDGAESDAFLGLPRDVALGAVTRTRLDDELTRLTSSRGASFFPDEADPFFRADRLVAGSVVAASFSIVVVVDGEGAIETEHAPPRRVTRGATLLVPFACGAMTLTGACRAIACRPPAPP